MTMDVNTLSSNNLVKDVQFAMSTGLCAKIVLSSIIVFDSGVSPSRYALCDLFF